MATDEIMTEVAGEIAHIASKIEDQNKLLNSIRNELRAIANNGGE